MMIIGPMVPTRGPLSPGLECSSRVIGVFLKEEKGAPDAAPDAIRS
jgi:hypothetical protein